MIKLWDLHNSEQPQRSLCCICDKPSWEYSTPDWLLSFSRAAHGTPCYLCLRHTHTHTSKQLMDLSPVFNFLCIVLFIYASIGLPTYCIRPGRYWCYWDVILLEVKICICTASYYDRFATFPDHFKYNFSPVMSHYRHNDSPAFCYRLFIVWMISECFMIGNMWAN